MGISAPASKFGKKGGDRLAHTHFQAQYAKVNYSREAMLKSRDIS
jgi:hypothetical protein